jgi:HK97 family phage prohead protease
MLPARNKLQHRLASTDKVLAATRSYDAKQHSVEAIISMGSPVERPYGTEVLRISPEAVDLSRLREGGIPLLDHHQQTGINAMLGRLTDAWFERSALIGRFKFNQTPEGKQAEGMVARGEVTGVSAGYRVDQWIVTDDDGDTVDEKTVRWDDELTFTATRWQLLEASLVGVPADGEALVRGMPLGMEYLDLESVRARMRIRHRMLRRHMKVLGHG